MRARDIHVAYRTRTPFVRQTTVWICLECFASIEPALFPTERVSLSVQCQQRRKQLVFNCQKCGTVRQSSPVGSCGMI